MIQVKLVQNKGLIQVKYYYGHPLPIELLRNQLAKTVAVYFAPWL